MEHMLSAKIGLETGAHKTPSSSETVSLQPPVPVVGIASAAKAKKFYVEFLGFAVDWGWPEDDGKRPLYAQVSRSGVTLHLSEHNAAESRSDWVWI